MTTLPAAASTTVLAAVGRVSAELADLVALLAAGTTSDVPATIAAVESAGRLMDAARVFAAAPLARNPLGAERLGFASSAAAVATVAQISERAARARLVVAEGVTSDVSLSGATLAPRLPSVSAALAEGRIGLEAAVLVIRELDRSASRVPRDAGEVAEVMMTNLACGLDPTGQQNLPPVSVDHLTAEVRMLGAAIDPDGARPREERAVQRRDAWMGKQDDDGLLPFGARMLPEHGVLLMNFFEAYRRSPRFVDDAAAADDPRTPGQRRYDAFVEVLIAGAAADGAPQLNAHPVTVLVTVSAHDLSNPEGLESDPIGTMAGSSFPVSRGQVERFIDGNGLRQVLLTPAGAVTGITSLERCFTANQTFAIAARDGYSCSTPGCTTPHTALQVHHVIPWREGGATTTSNGILLCYWHHRRVDDGPWQYRIVNGLPEVRGPGIPEWARTARPFAAAAA